jgi:hypothetical protein
VNKYTFELQGNTSAASIDLTPYTMLPNLNTGTTQQSDFVVSVKRLETGNTPFWRDITDDCIILFLASGALSLTFPAGTSSGYRVTLIG